MSLANMMRSTCTLTRPTSPTKDSSGGKVDGTYATVAADQDCDLQPAKSDVKFKYRQMELEVSHSCFVTTDIGARQMDKVTVGSRTFTVQGYEPPAEGYSQWPGVMHLLEKPSTT